MLTNSNPGGTGTSTPANTAPTAPPKPPAPTQTFSDTASSQEMPVVGRPAARRRPRFVEPPRPETEALVNRRNLFEATARSAKSSKISRQRMIAGNLPDWEPMPPGGALIVK